MSEDKVNLKLPGGREIEISTGKYAFQSAGSVVVRSGGTVVLATVNVKPEPSSDYSMVPLTVEYRERAYAAGKIPGGFFKREGKPSDKEILSARLIDRAIRPQFPKGFYHETQVIIFVLSVDKETPPDVLGLVGASAAIKLAGIPFNNTIAAVRIGGTPPDYIINPFHSEIDEGLLDLVVAGCRDGIVMVEAGLKEVSEEDLIEAFKRAIEPIQLIVDGIEELASKVGVKPMQWQPILPPDEMVKEFRDKFYRRLEEIDQKEGKAVMNEKLRHIEKEALELFEEKPDWIPFIPVLIEEVHGEIVRKRILEKQERLDGRAPDQIRPINIEVSVLPKAHGSAIFTRGETQALVSTTLGTFQDVQIIDDIEAIEEASKRFMLHYNFPPFCVGEVKPMRGPARREIGHGALAERAVLPLIPPEEEFPYTIRIVSDILSSNGSSSMATVCGASLSLMDAGVPIREHVAGIAMGLVMEGGNYQILTDILGKEDHVGDMDFKVAGTSRGVTALQMDIKKPSLSLSILAEALQKAKQARQFVLEKMKQAISSPRPEISPLAPRMTMIEIKPEKIADVIGPGGRVIRMIIDQTGAQIDITQDGKVRICAPTKEGLEEAERIIRSVTSDVKEGEVYEGRVTRIAPFGAFVEIYPGKEGLLHISQISNRRISKVDDVLKVGDVIKVRVLSVDAYGRFTLTHKEFRQEEEQAKFSAHAPRNPVIKPNRNIRPSRPHGRANKNRRNS